MIRLERVGASIIPRGIYLHRGRHVPSISQERGYLLVHTPSKEPYTAMRGGEREKEGGKRRKGGTKEGEEDTETSREEEENGRGWRGRWREKRAL